MLSPGLPEVSAPQGLQVVETQSRRPKCPRAFGARGQCGNAVAAAAMTRGGRKEGFKDQR